MVALGVAVLAVIVILSLWGARVSRRIGTPFYRWAALGPAAGGALLIAGVVIVEGQIPDLSPVARMGDSPSAADVYADSTSNVFVAAVAPIAVGNALLVASIVVFARGSRSIRRDASQRS